MLHDFRFVEDDWESPTLGAWGLGWEVWCDGMEVGQFTYFQQVGGIPVVLPSFEMTYGLERLAMYVQGVERVYDLRFQRPGRHLRRHLPAQRARIQRLQFRARTTRRCSPASSTTPSANAPASSSAEKLALPAYDQCIKASHLFNLLDASGAIGVSRTRRLYRPRPQPGQSLLRNLARSAKFATPA